MSSVIAPASTLSNGDGSITRSKTAMTANAGPILLQSQVPTLGSSPALQGHQLLLATSRQTVSAGRSMPPSASAICPIGRQGQPDMIPETQSGVSGRTVIGKTGGATRLGGPTCPMTSSISSGAPGLTLLFGVQAAPTRAPAIAHSATRAGGRNEGFIRGSLSNEDDVGERRHHPLGRHR